MYRAFVSLLNCSIAGSVLILAVMAARLVLRNTPKRFICILWALAALRLLCPVTVSSPVSAYSYLPAAESTQMEYFHYNGKPEKPQVEVTVTGTIAARTEKAPAVYADSIITLWAAGAAAMVLLAAVSCFRLSRRVRESVRLEGNLFLCDRIPTPFIFGLLRPKIYLPSSLEPEKLPYVIAHERTHLHRGDHWWKAIGYTVLCLHWFNPLVWCAYALLSRDIEMACDEAVIRSMDDQHRQSYSMALLSCSVPKSQRIDFALAFGEVSVKERIIGIMKYKKPKLLAVVTAAVLCAVMAVCFLTNPSARATGVFDFNLPADCHIPETAITATDCPIICAGQRIGGFIYTDLSPEVLKNWDVEAIAQYLKQYVRPTLECEYMIDGVDPISAALIIVDLENNDFHEYMHFLFEKDGGVYDLWLDTRYVDGEFQNEIAAAAGLYIGEPVVNPDAPRPDFSFGLPEGYFRTDVTEDSCSIMCFTRPVSGDHDHSHSKNHSHSTIQQDGKVVGTITATSLTPAALRPVEVIPMGDDYPEDSYAEFAIRRYLESTDPDGWYGEYIMNFWNEDTDHPIVGVSYAITEEATNERREFSHDFFEKDGIVYDFCLDVDQVDRSEVRNFRAAMGIGK